MKKKEERWKVKGYITIFTPVMSAKKNGKGLWIPTQKLALLQLVETEKEKFSKEITRERLLKLKRRANVFGAEINSGSPKN